jgi:hypothetical protein
LGQNITRGELTIEDAKAIARKALFDNSNTLYMLNLQYTPLPTALTNVDCTSGHAVGDYLKSAGVDLVRIQWVDYVNFIVRPLKS